MFTPQHLYPLRSFVATILAALLLLAGCGYRGPLYLPEDAPAEAPGGEPAGAADEAAAEKDADDEDEKDELH